MILSLVLAFILWYLDNKFDIFFRGSHDESDERALLENMLLRTEKYIVYKSSVGRLIFERNRAAWSAAFAAGQVCPADDQWVAAGQPPTRPTTPSYLCS